MARCVARSSFFRSELTFSPQQTLPVLENPFSQRINAIIGKVREARRGPYYVRSHPPRPVLANTASQPHLFVVKEDGEPSLRQWALSLLIEDRMDQLPSYNQWIGQLKDKVRMGFRDLRVGGS